MARNRQSAKKAGSQFERLIADALAHYLNDDRIDRRVKRGIADCGDIGGVRLHGQRVVLECKNTSRINLAGWAKEADDERGNDDALAGVVIHKRVGKGDPLEQWVTMDLRNFIAILLGHRIEEAK